jgi:serine/threonine-protein kinase
VLQKPEGHFLDETPRFHRLKFNLARLARRVIALAVMTALGAGGYYAWPRLKSVLAASIPTGQPKATAVLRIESVPDGATVKINGEELGTTPLMIENLYPARDIEVTLIHRGYKPWIGKFRGGEPAAVEATLRR